MNDSSPPPTPSQPRPRKSPKPPKKRRESEVGKRERKMNRAFEDFSVDTKTAHAIIANKQPTTTSTTAQIQPQHHRQHSETKQQNQSPKTPNTQSRIRVIIPTPPSNQALQSPSFSSPSSSSYSPEVSPAKPPSKQAPPKRDPEGLPEILRKCHQFLRIFSNVPETAPFREPVDYIALQIPDYPTVIQNPIDFSVIRKRLELSVNDSNDGGYLDCNEFADDMRLCFSNAMLYNPIGHPIHESACALQKVFEKYFAILSNLPLGEPLVIHSARLHSEIRHSFEEVTSNKPPTQELQPTSNENSNQSSSAVTTTTTTNLLNDEQRERRRKLLEKISTMNSMSLGKIIDVLAKNGPPYIRRSLLTATVFNPVVEADFDTFDDNLIEMLEQAILSSTQIQTQQKNDIHMEETPQLS